MSDLTPEQIRILKKLGEGCLIAYSRDGDLGWLTGVAGIRGILADKDIWELRKCQYIEQESDEREDDYGCDKISAAGRLALSRVAVGGGKQP
jgi:hypothetical protein